VPLILDHSDITVLKTMDACTQLGAGVHGSLAGKDGRVPASLNLHYFIYTVRSADHHGHSVNNRPVKRLTLVARLPPAFYIGPHADWNYGIVTPFS